MDHDEIEVKYHVPDMTPLRQRLVSLNASSSGRVFEKNIRFEDADNSLITKKSLLRLRQDGQNTLTYKQVSTQEDNQFKIYREIETHVSDFEATCRILEVLGYSPRQVYEKYRETFTMGKTIICLDTMPYGDFIEIEGDKNGIREMTDRLGLNWGDRILATYLEMFEYIQEQASLAFNDLTFVNFDDVRYDFSACWKYFEQGGG